MDIPLPCTQLRDHGLHAHVTGPTSAAPLPAPAIPRHLAVRICTASADREWANVEQQSAREHPAAAAAAPSPIQGPNSHKTHHNIRRVPPLSAHDAYRSTWAEHLQQIPPIRWARPPRQALLASGPYPPRHLLAVALAAHRPPAAAALAAPVVPLSPPVHPSAGTPPPAPCCRPG